MSEETPTMEVRARLTADSGEFVRGMAQAQASAQQFISHANKTTMAVKAIGVAFAAIAGTTIAFGEKSFMAAARVQELDVAIQAVGKSTGLGADVMQKTALAIKSMGIEMNAAQKSTLLFAQNNLDLAKASEMARVAQDLAVLTAKNSTEEFNALTYAVMTGNAVMMRTAGINGSNEKAYAKMAATLGVTTKQLTEAQKTQARMNMVLEEGAKVAGTYEAAMQTPAKVLRSFPRIFDDIQVGIGNSLLKGFGPLIFHLYHMVSAFKDAIEGTGAFHDILVAVGNVVQKLTAPVTAFLTNMQDWITRLDKINVNFQTLETKIKNVLPVVAGLGTAFAVIGARSSQFLAAIPGVGQAVARMTGPLGGSVITLLVLAATSAKVRSAFVNLISSLSPLLGILKSVSAVVAVIGQIFVQVLAIAIQKVADTINALTGFFKEHKTITEVLIAIIAIATASFYAESIALAVMSAAETVALWAMYALDAATGALAVTMGILTSPVFAVIVAIVGLVTVFVIAWKHSETFRNVVSEVFNTVAHIIGKVIGFVLDRFADLLMAISHALDVHDSFGRTVAAVFNFIKNVILTVVIFVVNIFKELLSAISKLTSPLTSIGKIVGAVFNFIGNVIATAVVFVIAEWANIIKGIATLVHWFGYLQNWIGEVFSKIGQVISLVANFIGDVVSKIANWIGTHLIDPIRDKLSDFFNWLSGLAKKVPIIGNLMGAGLSELSGWLNTNKTPAGMTGALDSISTSANGATVAVNHLNSASNKLTQVSTGVLNWSKGWGNYDSGLEGTLSKVANFMLTMATNVQNFGAKFSMKDVLTEISNGANVAANGLQGIVNVLGKIKDADVGAALVSGLSDAAKTSSLFIAGMSSNIKDFMSGDVLGKTTGAIGNVIQSLKDALGFGNTVIQHDEHPNANVPTAPTAPTVPTDPNGAVAKLQAQADLMKKISEAMQSGIDSIQKTIDDMAQAAQDFAKSLKDTIVNFAGLQGVGLPDGFIPQAKSLIANMQEKLNKAKQFAMQIGELQMLGLDSSALKDIIEAGPMQGAQLAAAILGGGQEAVNQVSALQKQIQFTGSLIGGFGANAVYGQPIFDANASLNKITDAKQNVSTSGNQITIQQGAFQITVDGSGITDPALLADLIAKKVQNEFDALSRQLAVK